jgi:hypothetical protein
MKDTLVIMGSHPRTRGDFDFSRQDCDIIIFNEAAKQEWVKRADYVLQIHDPIIWKNPQNRNDPQHYEWLKSTTTPVYMQDVYPDVPNSVRFPKDEILTMLPNARNNGELIREVDCSPAWALALGIYQGYKRIEIYGVELESNTEYQYQQGNFKYWCGIAAGRGVELDIHSSLFGSPLYGYEGEVSIPYETFQERIDTLMPLKKDKSGTFSAHAVTMTKAFDGFISGDVKDFTVLVQNTITAANDLSYIEGAMQENLRYKGKADKMRESGGDFIFSRQEFEQGAAASRKNFEQTIEGLNMMKGQLELVHGSTVGAAKDSPKRKKLMASYSAMLQEFVRANGALGLWRGVMDENYRYMSRLDAGIKAAGGVKSEEAILNQ